MTDEELLERYTKEQLAHRAEAIELVVSLPKLSAVIAALQLALRHPGFTGASRQLVEEFVARGIANMKANGLVYTAIVSERGNDPRYDEASA
jgi:hypothetical protein